jgi:hypothetical protein
MKSLLLFNKILLNSSYLIIILVGCLLITTSILYLFDSIFLYEFSATYSIRLFNIVFFLTGIITFILIFIGAFALKRSNTVILTLNLITFIALFTVLFYLGAKGFTLTYGKHFEHMNLSMKKNMFKIMKNINNDEQDKIKFNWLHTQFKCCGVNSHLDWRFVYLNVNFSEPTADFNNLAKINKKCVDLIHDVPDSCCIKYEFECGKLCHYNTKDFDDLIRLNGCFQAYSDYIVKQFRILCIISLFASCVLIISVLVSFFMMIFGNANFYFNIPSFEI